MAKKCSKCGTFKELKLFKKNQKGDKGRSSWCKKCASNQSCEYQKNNRDKANANNERYKETEKGKLSILKYKRSEAGKTAKRRNHKTIAGRSASFRAQIKRKNFNKNSKNNLSQEQWREILKKQNNMCVICNVEFTMECIYTRPEKDHIIPLSKSGSFTKNNIQALCRFCNASKGNRIYKKCKDSELTFDDYREFS